jgi:hypothetical protein
MQKRETVFKIGQVLTKPEESSSRLVVIPEQKRTTQQFSSEEIKELKWRWKKCADRIVQVTKPGAEFIIDESNRDIIDGLFWWFFNDPRSCYDLKKGILLKGTKGTGKSTLITIFREFFIEIQSGFAMSTAMKISLEYARTGEVDQWLTKKIICIDEIGRENMGKHYGNELNVIGYLLHERYALWQTKGICTIATTNKDAQEIEDLYGDVIRDRVKEMFNHIPMVGESRR